MSVESLHQDLQEAREKRAAKPRGKRAHLDKVIQRIRRRIDRAKLRRAKRRERREDAEPNVALTRISGNRSSRGGVKPSLIVLHSTESDNINDSTNDLASILSWFANPSAQASSHVLTDADGYSARCVPDADKAWTQVAFNSVALSIEQIGRASQSSWSEAQEDETARWIALWCRTFNIPCQRGEVSGSTVTRAGIVTHAQLGAAGGGHTDPGSGYRVDKVIEKAQKLLD